jgi:lipopolysaccharide export system protein LptA
MRLQRIAFHRAVRILSGILPVVIVAFVSIAAWNYWARTRDLPPRSANHGGSLAQDVAVQAGPFNYMRDEGGKRQFFIQGSELVVMRDNRNLLSDVDVIVFSQKEGEPDRRIHGDKCTFAQDEKERTEVRCNGNVSVELDPGTVAYTQELHYDSKTDLISSPGATRLERPGHMNGAAGQMQYYVEAGLLRLTNSANIELTDGGSLHTGVAVFQQKENWVTVSQGIELTSANGWLRGGSGRADLAPGTYRPTKATIEGGASLESRSPRSVLNMTSDWLQSDLSPEGKAEHVVARGRVVAKNTAAGEDKSMSGTLSSPEVETWFNQTGRPETIEARQKPTFETEAGEVTLTAENTIHIDYARRSINTKGASEFTSETSSIVGHDFQIASDETKNQRIFTTASRAKLTSPDMTTHADKTTAHIDATTNKIVSLEQTGKVTLRSSDGQRNGSAGKLTVKGDDIILEQDNPEITEGSRVLKGRSLTISQAKKKFVAVGQVTMGDTSSKTQTIIVTADRADGDDTKIDYKGNVQLIPGKDGKIEAAHLVAFLKNNRFEKFEAYGGVTSRGTRFSATSRDLIFTDPGNGSQTARYIGGVVATQKDEQGVLVLKTDDLDVNLRSGQLENLVATKGAHITQGSGRKGHGERVQYDAKTGEILLVGTSDAEAEIRSGEDVVRGCTIQIQKNGGEKATPCSGRSVTSTVTPKKN